MKRDRFIANLVIRFVTVNLSIRFVIGNLVIKNIELLVLSFVQ